MKKKDGFYLEIKQSPNFNSILLLSPIVFEHEKSTHEHPKMSKLSCNSLRQRKEDCFGSQKMWVLVSFTFVIN